MGSIIVICVGAALLFAWAWGRSRINKRKAMTAQSNSELPGETTTDKQKYEPKNPHPLLWFGGVIFVLLGGIIGLIISCHIVYATIGAGSEKQYRYTEKARKLGGLLLTVALLRTFWYLGRIIIAYV